MENMTVLTKDVFEKATSINSIDEAAAVLLHYEYSRTLGEILGKFYPAQDLENCLVAGWMEWFPESKADSVRRKVQNWLGGRTQSIGKADAYVVSRILNLSLEQANDFLEYATGESIHWRDPEEIVQCYALLHQIPPAGTKELLARAKQLPTSDAKASESAPDNYTAQVYQKLQSVLYADEDTLFAFLEREQSHLGVLHNTAYDLFTSYMTILKQGYSDTGVEAAFYEMKKEEQDKAAVPTAEKLGIPQPKPMTARDVLETYLYRKCVPVQARGSAKVTEAFSAVQRSIRRNWPDEVSLSKMEARKQDVSRKALILLFLATDGSDSQFANLNDDDDSAEDVFLDVYMRLDVLLKSCGFPQLDPRNPFDWLILFCISSGDLWVCDARLQGILSSMFPKAQAS